MTDYAMPTQGGNDGTWGTDLRNWGGNHASLSTGFLHNILQNSADTDTTIDLGNTTSDKIILTAGGEVMITCTEDGSQDKVIIGDQGDIDFIADCGAANALVVQGSSGKVGVGNADPDAYLDGRDDLVIGNLTGQHGLTIASNSASSGIIAFADETSGAAEYVGQIQYDHASDYMSLWASSTEAVFIKSTGVGIGVTPLSMFHLGFGTEELELQDAGSAGATQQDWIQVEVGGNTGYIHVYAAV